MKRVVLIFMSAVIVLTLGPIGSAYGLSYYGYQQWGGTWHDANKTPDRDDDGSMCWAAAASNALDWSGWGSIPSLSIKNHNDIFRHFKNSWTDQGGLMIFGWDWWFDGSNFTQGEYWSSVGWSQVEPEDLGKGGFWPDYEFDKYYHYQNNRSEILPTIDNFLHDGYSTTLAVYKEEEGQKYGHALTCWGYEYNDGDYLGIYVTDSDDYSSALKYYTVTENGDRWYMGGSYEDWYIGAIQALDRRPVPGSVSSELKPALSASDRVPVPFPGTFWLCSSGLVGLLGLRKKFKKQAESRKKGGRCAV